MQSPAADTAPAAAGKQQPEQQLGQLALACNSLWLATLSLMTAYMQQRAPAHRCLLARRIARNFETLHSQECYGRETRATFAKLANRWKHKAEKLSPTRAEPDSVFTRLQRLFAR